MQLYFHASGKTRFFKEACRLNFWINFINRESNGYRTSNYKKYEIPVSHKYLIILQNDLLIWMSGSHGNTQ